jgi:exo-beta-1,3-glucanase (GH17 family)
MSYRYDRFYNEQVLKFKQQGGLDLSGYSLDELKALWKETLESGMHGLCFSMYEDGQEPGDHITEAQVERRIQIIKPYTQWVRSFSCIEGNEHVPRMAHKHSLKTLVGAWLGSDLEDNEKEINGLIELAKEGVVNIAAVGNEVLYRNDLSLDQLLEYMRRVREAIPDHIPIGYVDAYYEFSSHPELVEASDVILSNCYPFWEGCPIEYSLNHMQSMFAQAVGAGKGKKVIITETGWPNMGEALRSSEPTDINAMTYFINTQAWSKADDIEIFYFSSFDESWKVGAEGDVGAYWGLWDKHEKLKY